MVVSLRCIEKQSVGVTLARNTITHGVNVQPASSHARAQNASTVDNAVDGNGHSKLQKHLYLQNYLPAFVWGTMEDTAKSPEQRIDAIIDLCHAIGLKFMDVETKKRISGLALLAENRSAMSAQSGKAMYDLITTLNNRKRAFRASVPTTLKIFPEDVKEFVTLFPTCYQDGHGPIASRIDPARIINMVPMIPARKNNALLNTGCDQMQTPNPQHQHLALQSNPMQMLMQMQMQMFRGMMNMNQNGNNDNMQVDDPLISFHRPAADQHRQLLPALTNGNPQASSPREDSPTDKSPTGTPTGNPQAFFQDSSVTDDIDAMLSKIKPPATIDDSKPATVYKKKTPPSLPTTQKKPKASILRRPSASVAGRRPKLTDTFPVLWNGCKIYSGAGKFRVLPKPGVSLYDKSFAHGSDKELAFKKALDFCDKPIIPNCSVNFA